MQPRVDRPVTRGLWWQLSYGGQAVLEGVMMRGPTRWAVAVRTPGVTSRRSSTTSRSPQQRHRIWRLPVIRGVIALGESLAIGFRALAISANYAAQEEGDDGEVITQISRGQIIFSFVIAIGFALMLFKVGPGAAHELAADRGHGIVRDRRRRDPRRRVHRLHRADRR